jgi:hypothetical protein
MPALRLHFIENAALRCSFYQSRRHGWGGIAGGESCRLADEGGNMSNIANEICNPSSLRQKGIAALTAALGPVGMAQFFRQFEHGTNTAKLARRFHLSDMTIRRSVAVSRN